jgi:hypothetical protein
MPIGAALAVGQGLYGLYNAIKSGQEAKDYQAKMERMARSSPVRQANPELANYYGEALNRYRENPFTTPYYTESIKQANRAAANAIGAMQTRGAAIGSIGRINQGLMDASNRGVMGAIQNKNAQFSQLGSATQMKKAEEDQMFDINQMTPYNRMLQLQQLKTQAANDRFNAGLSMGAQGLSNLAQIDIAKQMYPNGVDDSNVNKKDGSFFSNIFGNKEARIASRNAALAASGLKSNLNTLGNIQKNNALVFDWNNKTFRNR